MELLSKMGCLNTSDWVSNGFEGRFQFKIILVLWRLENLKSVGDGCFQRKTCVRLLLLVGQIDQIGLILQIIFQKWSLLKLISEGSFF